MMIDGTSGDDDLTGTGDPDDFNLSQGGHDIARGLGGDDSFAFGAAFDDDDRVFGGTGADSIFLFGAAGDLHIDAHSIDSVEQFLLLDASDYTMFMSNSALSQGETLAIAAGGLTLGHSLNLFASAEFNAAYVVIGGADEDVIETGGGNDSVFGGGGDDIMAPGLGKDEVNGGAGSDIVVFFGDAAFGKGDRIDGGVDGEPDTIDLHGDYSSGLEVTSKMMLNIDRFIVEAGTSYTLDFSRANAALGSVEVLAGNLEESDVLNFTAAESETLMFLVDGGAGDDMIAASKAGGDLIGNGGADTLTGNKGVDVFWYIEGTDSTGPHYDTVIGFNVADDRFNAQFTPTSGVPDAVDDAVKHGTLSVASFTHDLKDAVGAAQLGADNAVLFQAKHGDLAGQWFLIVDVDGAAGYQNGDMVVHLQDAAHLGSFGLANFGA